MRVLVLESERRAADDAIDRLEAAGHEVVRCHEPAWRAFPCVGMTGTCPVEAGVDVALVVRSREYGLPSPFEDGARCAARAGVPLVVMGDAATNPYEQWTVAHADLRTVVHAVEEAVHQPLPHLSGLATEVVRDVLTAFGLDPAAGGAEVHRDGSGLWVDVVLAETVDPNVANQAVVRVAAAVRAAQARSPRIDVGVRRVASQAAALTT